MMIGLFILLAGVLTYWSSRLPWIGRLPGDIFIRKGNFSFYFPLATCLLLSVLLTILLNLFRKP